MTHTHHYSFWHSHEHCHTRFTNNLENVEIWEHNGGHYHNWLQTHEHGPAGRNPHTHKARQFHESDDQKTKHHHRINDHEEEE